MRRALLISAFCAGCSVSPPADPNARVLEILRSYPTDGSFGYFWPREGAWDGTPSELWYQGVRVTQGDGLKRSYCCGLTYEVFLKVQRSLHGDAIPNITPTDLEELRRRWYGTSTRVSDRRQLVALAIESMKFGVRVARLEDARPGDFVQFWRASGSGHSAVFIEWIREGGTIAGLTYWSSQKSTRGIGYASERIGGKDGVKADEIYLARLTPLP